MIMASAADVKDEEDIVKVDETSSRLDGRYHASGDGLMVVAEGSDKKMSLAFEC